MRHPYLFVVFFFILFASFVYAEEEKTPDPNPSPVATTSPEVAPTPTPKPELKLGNDVDGVNVVFQGPFHFRKDEISLQEVNVSFHIEAASEENKKVAFNTNLLKALQVEVCFEESRDKILTPNSTPEGGEAFDIFLNQDSFYSGTIKNLEKYFDFEVAGRYWIRAKLNHNDKLVTSDWCALDIYTKDCVTIMTREGAFTIWLRYDKAPKSCEYFMNLVKKGFYDHLLFHRVENKPNFKLIQGGCPHGDGSGGPSQRVEWEDTGLLHEAGAVAYGLSSNPSTGQPDRASGGSQFYVCAEPIPSLDGKYCVFGKVIDGLNVVKKIAAVQTDPTSQSKTRPRVFVEMQQLIIEYRP